MSTKVLKLAFLAISAVISSLMNASLSTCVFPTKWKQATIVPIYKTGSKTDPNNYRPISLLPIPGKMLEKIMHQHIMGYINEHNLLHENQGGFRKGRSTTHSIAALTNSILENTNDRLITATAFIDFSKAFDTVDHKILLSKLANMGIGGETLRWITDYLRGREQRTRLDGTHSQYVPVTYGVPQGSVLGPLLFIIFINDLVDACTFGEVRMYADDTVISVMDKNQEVALEKLSLALEELNRWSTTNKITINQTKSKVVLFGARKGMIEHTSGPKLGEMRLDIAQNYKYLGLVLDTNLTYSDCVKDILKKVAHKIWLLAKLKNYISNKTATLLYKTMVLPYFDYADIVYHAAPAPMLMKLQRMQNQGLKICGAVKRRFSTREIHVRLQLPKLEERQIMHLKVHAFHQVHTQDNLDDRERRGTRLGDGPLLKTHRVVRAGYARSVNHMAATVWNALAPNDRNTPTRTEFVCDCQKVLMKTISDMV